MLRNVWNWLIMVHHFNKCMVQHKINSLSETLHYRSFPVYDPKDVCSLTPRVRLAGFVTFFLLTTNSNFRTSSKFGVIIIFTIINIWIKKNRFANYSWYFTTIFIYYFNYKLIKMFIILIKWDTFGSSDLDPF